MTKAAEQIPGVSPTNRYTTILPLGLVLLVCAFKESQEDLKRHQFDKELNARCAKVLSRTGTSTFIEIPWRDIRVGDIVRIEFDDFIPADVLLSSSEPEGLCHIETSNLDGLPTHISLTTPHLVQSLAGQLRYEQPNNSLYNFEGTLELRNPNGGAKVVPLGPDQMLLRGTQLRNTPWCYGSVVYTGYETKLIRDATAAPIKRTAVERQVNAQIILLFILLVLSIGSSIGAVYQQAQLINSDLDMYYAPTDTPALCRTSSLVEELGQIEYVYSDKTGTLTHNEMELRIALEDAVHSTLIRYGIYWRHRRARIHSMTPLQAHQRVNIPEAE
ncbi:hypothetical protein M422DRAFT_61304 [Sphaerobolus stellatus SS14]|uniref:P-type phospholipid transporter n=1 Tax=Sphaerobolus stellatus (strain SS14) TaxID=990650 RepID=A0A0C9VCG9_SPHS4|nr:hypothetical protein M422DRAFT_61304 [Sphaerobolus stellatus SS14]